MWLLNICQAQTLTTLVSFNGDNGANPNTGLAIAADGYFYGTTSGTVFKMSPDGNLTTLASFDGINGDSPSGLVQGTDGDFYGTTRGGGASYDGVNNFGSGTVFKVTPNGLLTTLYSFSGGTDGGSPNGDLVQGNDGNFYGMTTLGGDLSQNSGYGFGTVFKITPDGALTTLVSFDFTNGASSVGALTKGSDGNFYGATRFGGMTDTNGNTDGTIFRVTPSGALTTLVSLNTVTNRPLFFPPPSQDWSLLENKNGNFYGTFNSGSQGAVFEMTPAGAFKILLSLPVPSRPFSGLMQGSDGNFYGTSSFGTNGIFQVTSDGIQTHLVTFNGTNGLSPRGRLVQGTDGVFYGTTSSGGDNGLGTVFRLNLGTFPTILTQPTDQFAYAGSNATFTVAAIGQSPLSYQWWFGNTPIAGATNATLILNSVTAANSGGYSVIVSNPYGSAASATAYLGVLAVDTTTPCYLMTATPLPDRQSGKTNLVLVTHGWIPPWEELSSPDWIADLAGAIGTKLNESNVSDWQAEPYYWITNAETGLNPNAALDHAKNIGTQIGRQIAEQGWQHVHLIAHSAGSALIQAAADAIRSNAPSTVIQTTFLDPFLGTDYRGLNWYGSNADWSDAYDAYNFWTDQFGSIVLLPNLTYGNLVNSYNVDVTWVDPNKTLQPILCPSSTADSTAPLLNNYCGTNALSSHGWPIDFYTETVFGTETNCAAGFGFPLSIESGGWVNLGNYHEGLALNPLCGSSSVSQNQLPLITGLQLQIGTLPNAMSSLGATLSGNSGLNLSSTSLQIAPLGKFKPLDENSTGSTNSPAWFAVGLTISNAVNFVQFDAAFTDSNNAEGLLTVLWDTNQIGTVDERVVSPGLQTYRFFLPNTVTNGVYVLGFRLDSFDSTSSSIMVTNVATGFIGITTPLTLGISLTNAAPLLQLTGASNYNYLVESSTNLVDWTPTAMLLNSNGTVLFPDPTSTNSSARFYRAIMQ